MKIRGSSTVFVRLEFPIGGRESRNGLGRGVRVLGGGVDLVAGGDLGGAGGAHGHHGGGARGALTEAHHPVGTARWTLGASARWALVSVDRIESLVILRTSNIIRKKSK